MTNFRQLNKVEYDKVWDKFYDLFHFKPSVNHFPAVETDKPQLKIDIKNYFSQDFSTDKLEDYALNLFLLISKPGDRFYALDWQHECYDFDPREQMDRDEFDEWIVPVLPNGDYYIFLTNDFNNVWFGHPWEQTITLIGHDIVKQGQKLNKNFLR